MKVKESATTTDARPLPAELPADKAAKLKTAARKAQPGGVADALRGLGVSESSWQAALVWLMREQGDQISQQWQIVWDLAALEQPLAMDDVAWLLSNIREPLAYRAKEGVLPDNTGLLPLWHFTLERLVMQSFAAEPARLRERVPADGLRVGLLYAFGQLGVALSDAEKAEVQRALARTWLTQKSQSGYALPGPDGIERLTHPEDEDDVEAVEALWSRIVRPFGSAVEWSNAVCAVMAELEQIASRWERPTTLLVRWAPHARAATPEQAAIALALSTQHTDEPEGLRVEVGQQCLADLEDDVKRDLLSRVTELAEETDRTIPDEIRALLIPSGAGLVAAIEAAAAKVSAARDTRIYLPILGQPSKNGVAQLVARCYLDDIPTHNDVEMDHLLTLDLGDAPELQARLGAETVTFYLSSLTDNGASELDSEEVGVQLVSAEEAKEKVEGGTPFRLVGVDVPAAVFASDPPQELRELASLIQKASARVLGPPRFLQGEARTEGFVMQLSESFVAANFGGGILYLYDDDGFWQA